MAEDEESLRGSEEEDDQALSYAGNVFAGNFLPNSVPLVLVKK